MKQRIHRYIAIALGIAALLTAIIEVLIYGFPLFAFFFVAGAKDFYDSSVGRVHDSVAQHRFGTLDTSRISYSSPNHFESLASQHSDYNDPSSSYARGEHPYVGGSINNFD